MEDGRAPERAWETADQWRSAPVGVRTRSPGSWVEGERGEGTREAKERGESAEREGSSECWVLGSSKM